MNQLLQYGKWDYYTNKLYYMGSLHGILVCWLMISLGIIWTNNNWGWSAAIRGIPFSTNRSGDDDQSIVVVDQQAGWDSINDHRDVSDMCYDDYHTRLKMILQSTLWDQDTLLVEFTYQLYIWSCNPCARRPLHLPRKDVIGDGASKKPCVCECFRLVISWSVKQQCVLVISFELDIRENRPKIPAPDLRRNWFSTTLCVWNVTATFLAKLTSFPKWLVAP